MKSKKWLDSGKSEEGFKQNWGSGGGEAGSLADKRHRSRIDANLRAQAEEKEWRAGQAAGYEKLGEDGQFKAGQQASVTIKKDKDLYSKINSDKASAYGVKDLFQKMAGEGGYSGGPSTLTGEERAKMVEGLERLGVNPNTVFRDLQSKSPMKRMHDSPFKRTPQIRRSNYVNASQQIGDSVQGAIDEKRAREQADLEAERQARAAEMQHLQLAQMKQAQYESLNVPADTGVKSADQYIQGASRQMVDAQAGLVSALKNGEIDTDQFAQKSALIKSQIPALKNGRKVLGEFQSMYTDLLSQGNISKADDGQSGQLYDLIQSGEMLIQPDEAGNMMMMSPDGGISVPLTNIDRIPKPIPKAPEMAEIVKPAIDSIGEGLWDPEAVKKQMDGLFTGNDINDQKTLKAMAVDRMGLSLEEANELLNAPPESDEYTSALEERVEGGLLSEAQKVYDGNLIKRQQAQANLALRQAQAANQQRLANDPNNGAAKQTAVMLNSQLEQQQSQAAYNGLNDTVTKTLPENGVMNESQAQSFTSALRSKLPPWVKVDYQVPSRFAGFGSDYSKGGNIVFTDADGEEIETVPSNDRALLDQWLKNFSGVKPGQ